MGKFERTSREYTKPPSERGAEVSSDDVLIETAKKLGISTEGKTKGQISQEIVMRIHVC